MSNTDRHIGIRNIRRSIKLIYDYDKKYVFLCSFQLIINGLQPTIELFLLQTIINDIQKHVVSYRVIVWLLLILCIIKIASSVINNGISIYVSKFKYLFDRDLEMKLYNILANMDTEEFESPKTYDLLKRTETQRVDSILLFFTQSTTIVQSLITSIGLLIIVSRYNLIFIFIFVISPIVQYIIVLRIGKEQYKLIMERTLSCQDICYTLRNTLILFH